MSGATPGNKQKAVIIKFIEEPPKYIFCDSWFDVGLSILTPRITNATEEISAPIKLKPKLFRYTQGKISSQAVHEGDNVELVMNPDVISFPVSKTGSPSEHIARGKLKISSTSTKGSNPSAFVIQFEAETEESLPYEVPPIYSQPLSIVTAKISLEAPEWESTWYKDMGGRDKAIECTASLLNDKGEIMKGRKISLQLTLLYDNEEMTAVSKQDIFRMVGASTPSIDPSTGKCKLYFRIEDVSKNHQGQNFVIKVASDESKHLDIAPAYTKPVCVRSKKKKDSAASRKRPPSADNSVQVLKKHSSQYSFHPSPHEQPHFGASQMMSKEPFPLQVQNPQHLRDAMKSVIKWTEEVVNGLGPLKWNVIGYSQNAEGVIDYNQPYHSMPNPNEKINDILKMYSDHTRENLRMLTDAVENSTAMNNPQPSQNYPYNNQMSNYQHQIHQHGIPPPHFQQNPNQMHGNHYHWQGSYQDQSRPESYMAPMNAPVPENMMSPIVQRNLYPPDDARHQRDLNKVSQDKYWNSPGYKKDDRSKLHTHLENYNERKQSDSDMPDIEFDIESKQTDVTYVLGKVFKSMQTNEDLGFPAYSLTKELLGFYKESSSQRGGRFSSIDNHQDEFGPPEMEHASNILKNAIINHSTSLYNVNNWDSISNMLENMFKARNEKTMHMNAPHGPHHQV